MGSKSEFASSQFAAGFGCAASVFSAFSEGYGLDSGFAAKLACGLGGGCASGEICGAASGGVLVVSLKHGQEKTGDADAKANCHKNVVQFIRKFKEKNGALACRDMLKCDPTTEEGHKVYLNKRTTVCPAVVKNSADILEELGY